MKRVDQDDLETLGLDAEAAALIEPLEEGRRLLLQAQGFGFIRPLGETDRRRTSWRTGPRSPAPVPLRLPPIVGGLRVGSHNGATVAREVRPLDACRRPSSNRIRRPPS